MRNLEVIFGEKSKFFSPLYAFLYFLLVLGFGFFFQLSILKISFLIFLPIVIIWVSLDIFWHILLLYFLVAFKYIYFNLAKSISLHSIFIPFSFLALIFYCLNQKKGLNTSEFIKNKIKGFWENPLNFLYLLLFASLVSTIFAKSFRHSIHYWIMLLQFIFLYYWIKLSVRSVKNINKIFWMIFIVNIIIIPLGIKAIITTNNRLAILGFSSNEYGAYLGFILYSLLSLIFLEKRKFLKLILIFLLLVTIISIIATKSRGSQLALLVSLLVFFLLMSKGYKKKIITILAILLIFSPILINIGYEYIERFKSLQVGKFSTSDIERVGIWFSSIKLFQTSPFWGVGPNNFGNNYYKYFPFKHIIRTDLKRHAHNMYLNTLVEFGILGVLVLLVTLSYFFFRILHLKRSDNNNISIIGNSLLGFYVFFIVFNLFGTAWTIVGRQVQTTNLVIIIFIINNIESFFLNEN